VFYLEKGPDYYWHSHAFLTKFALFVIIAFVSVIPTLEFLSWRGATQAGQVPVIAPSKKKLVTAIIHAELAAIVIIVLCAAIMARGGWI
jgi:putative membrane protein